MRLLSKIAKIGIVLMALCTIFLASPSSASANDTTSKGAITFKSETSSSSSEEPKTDSSTDSTGKLPNLGALLKVSLSISGVVLLFIVLFLILWKRQKKDKDEADL